MAHFFKKKRLINLVDGDTDNRIEIVQVIVIKLCWLDVRHLIYFEKYLINIFPQVAWTATTAFRAA